MIEYRKDHICVNCGLCCELLADKKQWLGKVAGVQDEAGCEKLINGKCTIYKDRPESCKVYPFNNTKCLKEIENETNTR